MKLISIFYTLFWMVFFPTCIAFNDLPGFRHVDEAMTAVLIVFTVLASGIRTTNSKPWKEYVAFLALLVFYAAYSLYVSRVNVAEAVHVEFVQQLRPYSVLLCTWILNPKFSRTQKRLMLVTMIATLLAWIVFTFRAGDLVPDAEFPVLGQLAICTGMAYYIFAQPSANNKYVALFIVLVGLLAPKFKFFGEVVCFVGVVFFLTRRIHFKSPKTVLQLTLLAVVCIAFTWSRFEWYYVSGWENEELARPMTYKTALLILKDYFPFGPGMGTFGTYAAAVHYSPLYYSYHLNEVWGLSESFSGFVADAFYPTLAQYGVVGVGFFVWFWARRLKNINQITDIRYYRVALLAFFCLAIESVADTSYLSGKGMGYFMLLGLCLNSTYRPKTKEKAETECGEEATKPLELPETPWLPSPSQQKTENHKVWRIGE
ncbi:MAG: hypothetical protein ACI36Z_08345 [Alloprevotella sp.]